MRLKSKIAIGIIIFLSILTIGTYAQGAEFKSRVLVDRADSLRARKRRAYI